MQRKVHNIDFPAYQAHFKAALTPQILQLVLVSLNKAPGLSAW